MKQILTALFLNWILVLTIWQIESRIGKKHRNL